MKRFSLLAPLLAALALGAAAPAHALRLPIHMSYGYYEMAKPGPFDELTITLRWRKAPPPPKKMGYYAMFMFYFENKKGGYTGLQWDNDGTRAIFSLWDEPGKPSAQPEAGCRRFDHEGSGAMCLTPFEWTLDREYRLQVRRLPEAEQDGRGVRWRGSVVDLFNGKETVIGTIRLGEDAKGHGGLSAKSTTVTEYYGRGDPSCAELPPLAVDWTGPFAQGGLVGAKKVRTWYPQRSAKPGEKPPENCPNADVSSPAIDRVEHRVGGSTPRVTPHDKTFKWR
ncbi:MAG: hypothetical protein HQL51_06410 [Magnetococcales bacterium]|nr:hypothetical protein [Magnetococcales bacterium]